MSFIAGYLLGLDEGGSDSSADPRVKKLEALEALWTGDIEDGWNIRVKIASDIDNDRLYKFGSTHHSIYDYNECEAIYYCVYLNDSFKYAVCRNMGYFAYKENYQNYDVPDRLYYISRITSVKVTSGEIRFDSASSSGPSVRVNGSFDFSQTNYDWTDNGDRIEEETYSSNQTFGHSCGSFFGEIDGWRYIAKGTKDDFENAVYGLYFACLKRI